MKSIHMKYKHIIYYFIPVILLMSNSCTNNMVTQPDGLNPSLAISQGYHSQLALLSKKGFDITTKTNNDWVKKLKALNVSWHYSWGDKLMPQEPVNVDFVPMIWGFWGNYTKLNAKINTINQLADEGKVHYLLGFNEPDNRHQSNMPVSRAIAAWPTLMKANVPLGSPACANATGKWMQNFMAKVDSLHYRVDFVTVHYYKGINVGNFLKYLRKVHKMYHRPTWITEFAVADWNAKTVSTNKYSPSKVLTFMQQTLPAIDRLGFIQRYAWFSAKTTSRALGTSALFNPDGSLTKLGKFYASE